jgi:hypothetical protein
MVDKLEDGLRASGGKRASGRGIRTASIIDGSRA